MKYRYLSCWMIGVHVSFFILINSCVIFVFFYLSIQDLIWSIASSLFVESLFKLQESIAGKHSVGGCYVVET